MSVQDELAGGIAALEIAGDALQSAADMLADVNCDRWADRGGIGAPPKDARVAELYELAQRVVFALDRLDILKEGLE